MFIADFESPFFLMFLQQYFVSAHFDYSTHSLCHCFAHAVPRTCQTVSKLITHMHEAAQHRDVCIHTQTLLLMKHSYYHFISCFIVMFYFLIPDALNGLSENSLLYT